MSRATARVSSVRIAYSYCVKRVALRLPLSSRALPETSEQPVSQSGRSVVIDIATWRCAHRTAAGDVILGEGRHLAFDEVFLPTDLSTIRRSAIKNP